MPKKILSLLILTSFLTTSAVIPVIAADDVTETVYVNATDGTVHEEVGNVTVEDVFSGVSVSSSGEKGNGSVNVEGDVFIFNHSFGARGISCSATDARGHSSVTVSGNVYADGGFENSAIGVDAESKDLSTATVEVGKDVEASSSFAEATGVRLRSDPYRNAGTSAAIGNDVIVHSDIKACGLDVLNSDCSVKGVVHIVTESGEACGIIQQSDPVLSTVSVNLSVDAAGQADSKVTGVQIVSGVKDLPSENNVQGDAETNIGFISSNGDDAYGLKVIGKGGNYNIRVGTDINAIGVNKSKGIDISLTGEKESPLSKGSGGIIRVYRDVLAKGTLSDNTAGIHISGGDTDKDSDIDIQIGRNLSSTGDGIVVDTLGKAAVKIASDGIISSGGNNACLHFDDSVSSDNLSITAWKLETSGSEGPVFKAGDAVSEEIPAAVDYFIHVEQPDLRGAGLSVVSSDGTDWDDTYAWTDSDGSVSYKPVAEENRKVYVRAVAPEGYRTVSVYRDAEKTSALKKEGSLYYFIMPRGGGVTLNMAMEKISEESADPDDPADPADQPKTAREVKKMDLSGLTLLGKEPDITLYGPGKTISYNGRAHVWTEEKLNEKKKKKKVPDLDVSVNGIPGSVSFDFVYGKNKDASENKAYLYLKLKPFKASPSYNALDPKVRKKLKKEIKKINKALKNKKNRFYFTIKPLDLSGFVLDSSKSTAGSLLFYRKGLKSDTLTLSVKQGKKGGEPVFDDKTVKKAVLTANIAGYTFKIPKKQYTLKASSGKVTVEGKGKNLEGVIKHESLGT